MQLHLSGCAPPTDPKKSFRGGSISTFFNANQASSMFSWGFLTFSGSSAQSYIMKNSMPSFGDSIAMQSAISSFGSDTDQGGTPYIAALNYAKSVVSNDSGLVASGILAPLYEIIFLSDGYPSDALMSDGSVDFPSINAAISDISNLASGRIYFSAVYYGTINDPTAANTLQNMASVGKGQFVNANTQTTSAIAINNLITIPVGDCAD